MKKGVILIIFIMAVPAALAGSLCSGNKSCMDNIGFFPDYPVYRSIGHMMPGPKLQGVTGEFLNRILQFDRNGLYRMSQISGDEMIRLISLDNSGLDKAVQLNATELKIFVNLDRATMHSISREDITVMKGFLDNLTLVEEPASGLFPEASSMDNISMLENKSRVLQQQYTAIMANLGARDISEINTDLASGPLMIGLAHNLVETSRTRLMLSRDMDRDRKMELLSSLDDLSAEMHKQGAGVMGKGMADAGMLLQRAHNMDTITGLEVLKSNIQDLLLKASYMEKRADSALSSMPAQGVSAQLLSAHLDSYSAKLGSVREEIDSAGSLLASMDASHDISSQASQVNGLLTDAHSGLESAHGDMVGIIIGIRSITGSIDSMSSGNFTYKYVKAR